mmetsp:Transcript_40710/g.66039  ORF Transcript_40710/g.66039 Transcript_40710/m.66039 type:complete len:194 (-) Transcript_40710:352-933(-)
MRIIVLLVALFVAFFVAADAQNCSSLTKGECISGGHCNCGYCGSSCIAANGDGNFDCFNAQFTYACAADACGSLTKDECISGQHCNCGYCGSSCIAANDDGNFNCMNAQFMYSCKHEPLAPTSPSSPTSNMSTGSIIGIVIAAFFGVSILIATAIGLVYIRSRRHEAYSKDELRPLLEEKATQYVLAVERVTL